jgi:hypothetical protein
MSEVPREEAGVRWDNTHAYFPNDTYWNKFIFLMLSRPQQAQQAVPQMITDRARQLLLQPDAMMANFADSYLLFLRAVMLGGTLEPDTTWKVMVRVETSRKPLLIQVPLFDETVRDGKRLPSAVQH